MAIANRTVSYQPNRFLQQFETDLGMLPAYLAKPNDWLLLNRIPSVEFIESLKTQGLELPKLKRIDKVFAGDAFSENMFSEIRPWGWSPVFLHQIRFIVPFCNQNFQDDSTRFLCRDDRYFYSRKFSLEVLEEIVQNSSTSNLISTQELPIQCSTVENAEIAHQKNRQSVLKAPWSSSGRGLSMLRLPDFNTSVRNWAKGVIKTQGYIMCEPLLKKLVDFSFQFRIKQNKLQYLGITFFRTDEKGQYKGHYLHEHPSEIESVYINFIKTNEMEVSDELADVLSKKLKDKYNGYFGVDAMLVSINNKLKIQPCVEINLRYNMGIIAMELSKKVGKKYRQFTISTIGEMPVKNEILKLTEITKNSVYVAYLE